VRITRLVTELAREGPFRLSARGLVAIAPFSLETKSRWNGVRRPNYLLGLLAAARQAARQHHKAISVIEFGVAGGNGLLALEDHAAKVAHASRIRIDVYGFDAGSGLPSALPDYRDHCDLWMAGDYPMNIAALERRLARTTQLLIGDFSTVLETFMFRPDAPIGFAAIDCDLYSSTKPILAFLATRTRLNHTPLYFDDVSGILDFHQKGGQLLAIDEFNTKEKTLFIDRWRGLESQLIFPSSRYVAGMYVLHDLDAISAVRLDRAPETLGLDMSSYIPFGA
jgi:hypothetical protein